MATTTQPTANPFGASIKRREDPRFVTGRGLYTDDIKLPGMTHAVFVRSPYAHARVKKIDISRASKIAGVVAVLTRDDILHDQGIEPYYGPVFKDQTIVATEKVRHMGDPVAAVAALTADAAEAAIAIATGRRAATVWSTCTSRS